MRPSQGQGGRGAPPYEDDLEQRLRQAYIGPQWQGGAGVPGHPYGAAYALPYSLAPGFPQQPQAGAPAPGAQGAAGLLAPRVQYLPSGSQRPVGNQAFPAAGQGLALQLQPGFRPMMPQPYAAFYPQFQPAYGYLTPGTPWRPIVSPQMAPGFAQQGQPMQATFPFPGQPQPPAQAGRQAGRQSRGRGRAGRQQSFGRGRGLEQQQQANQQYRAMWQEVTQVRV